MQELPAIALVAEDVSLRMGGPDAARALHYFRGLRARGLDVHLVTRERHRAELCEHLAGDEERIHGVPDPKSAIWLGRLGLLLPRSSRAALTDVARSLISQRAQRRKVSQLVRRKGVRIVHQVTPSRPGTPSRMQGLGVPVVMGPLLDPRDAPPGFRKDVPRSRRLLARLSKLGRPLLHRILSGRRKAEVLLVANAQSSRAVPTGARGRKLRLPSDGIELSEWKARDVLPAREVPEFLFAGRLSRDCGADFLLDAFRLTLDAGPARLRIVGEGPLASVLQRRIEELDLADHVEWSGWLPQEARRLAIQRADALVFPGLCDAGAEVLMHAMATGLPVVATDWGAPSDLASDGAGLLVGPRTEQQFTHELASVMHRLADSKALRQELGERARNHARSEFDWSQRLDRLLDVYRLVAQQPDTR
jgi:glycosyltransferase involved in cell wall biosynthesis